MNSFYIQFIVLLISFGGTYHHQAKVVSSHENERELCFCICDDCKSSTEDLFNVDENEEMCSEKYVELHAALVYCSCFIPQTVTSYYDQYFVHFILFEADTSPPIVSIPECINC